jgi:hypothetical protein
MHPPLFRIQHRLSDWQNCVAELQCCGGSAGLPVRLLIQRRGDITFEAMLKRLRCKRCGKGNPAPVYLVAGHHRTARYGPTGGLGGGVGAAAEGVGRRCSV